MGNVFELFAPKRSADTFLERRRVIDVRVDLLETVWNSRTVIGDIESLAASIKEIGLLQPIVIVQRGWKYRIVSGHRRFKAVQSLKHDYIQAVTLDEDTDETTLRLMNLSENVNRASLRLYDTMAVIWELWHKYGTKAERIAQDTGLRISRIKTMVAVWPKLSTTVKEKWSGIESPLYEPSLFQLQKWSVLPWSEQNAAWRDWASDEEHPILGAPFPEIQRDKRGRPKRRKIKEVRLMLRSLGKGKEEQAYRRALLWTLGRRSTL